MHSAITYRRENTRNAVCNLYLTFAFDCGFGLINISVCVVGLIQGSKDVFDIEIVGVKAAIISDTPKSLWIKATNVVIPDFPQFEADLVNATQRLPVAEQFARWLGLFEGARMKLDHKLFDVVQTSWRGEYGVEWRPLRAFDVNLQYVDRLLYINEPVM